TEGKITALEKTEENYHKQIRHIQRSNTWKYSQPFRKLHNWFSKIIGRKKQNEQKHHVQELYAQVQDLKKQLYAKREQLRQARSDDRHLYSTQITSLVKKSRDNSKLHDYIVQAVQYNKQHVVHFYN